MNFVRFLTMVVERIG